MHKRTNGTAEAVEIDLQKLLLTYLRKWWLIVAAAVVAGGLTFGYTKLFITPQYRAGATIYVNNYRADAEVEYITGSSLAAAQQLVSTYANIIKSETVLGRVLEYSDLEYTTDDIREMMTTSQMGETELFKVYITHEDPQVAANVANAIAREALTAIEEFVEGSSAKVVDYASVPKERHTPSYSQNTILGCVAGCAAALIYITVMYLLDVRLRTAEDLEQLFEFPVLGQIPVFVSPEARSKNGYGYARKGYEQPEIRVKQTKGKGR